MIEKDCETCKEVMKVFGDYSPCVACDDSCSNWQPSELYTAYLAEKERAEQAEAHVKRRGELNWKYLRLGIELTARAERFRQVLNCPECGGKGGWTQLVTEEWHTCPKCAEIRKEARGGEVDG